jgi:23S rRNA pseudouridine1911/1915/1917 synthase
MAAMPHPAELEVPAGAAGSRLDTWLAGELGISRAAAAARVASGAVTVDGRRAAKSTRLRGGEAVSVAEEAPAVAAGPAPDPEIVWEDEHMLVVDKPPGLVVHPAPGHRGTTLVELLAERAPRLPEPRAVHRLDRDTSGLMLVARDETVQRQLQEALRRRAVEREYGALAGGRLRSRSGTIDAPLGRDPRRRTRMSTVTDKPREARTHFEVERVVDGFTLVRARLETGRTHQIRAHFAAIGHPLAGDREYGGPQLPGLERQFLHSARLALELPWSGERREWRSELPPDLRAALAGLDRGEPPDRP